MRFANPAEAIGGRHSEAWRLRCVEAQNLGGSDMLILAASWISLMASGELPKFLFCKKMMIIEHNSESITLGWSWGLLGAILKPFRRVLGSLGAVWEALGVVLVSPAPYRRPCSNSGPFPSARPFIFKILSFAAVL